MRKILLLTALLLLVCQIGYNQTNQTPDSLRVRLLTAKNDTSRVLAFISLCYNYASINPDSAKFFGEQGLTLAREINFKRGEAMVLNMIGRLYGNNGEPAKALKSLFDALQIELTHQYHAEAAMSLNFIGVTYWNIHDDSTAKTYYLRALELTKGAKAFWQLALYLNLADSYKNLRQFDSAFFYVQKADEEFATSPIAANEQSNYLSVRCEIQFQKGNRQAALDSLRKSLITASSPRTKSNTLNLLASFFKEMNQPDSAIVYARLALAEARTIDKKSEILKAADILAGLYETRDLKTSLYYEKIARAVNDTLFGIKKIQDVQKIIIDEQQRQREAEIKRTEEQNRLKQYGFLAGIGILFVIAFLLYRNNQQKQKANKILEKALASLKSAQAQLIQSEKMASLGELTAGIAHEIQNPLNFVTNFSELNKEMIVELTDEIDKGNYTDAKEIAKDIEANSEKINHHGKRADAIVKGMLQHSQSGKGQKEPTDINALCDEYLRLSYNGLRAKDKDFNAALTTDFDESIDKINIVPQDIGKVLLNLFNNAFYAENERLKAEGAGFKAAATVRTKKINDKAEIVVEDNGGGIPQNIIDKIFQPFFTTKPTGQGTGLGLSLVYDIVKAHGGEIKVETNLQEGTTFIIQLPVT